MIQNGQGLVKHWALLVVAECTTCGAASTVMLGNSGATVCPSCGVTHVLDSFHWDKRHPHLTQFGISASEPTIKRATS